MTSETAPADDPVVEEAIGWMIASREGLTAEQRGAFERWLGSDTRHSAAWNRLDASLNRFRVLGAHHVSGQQLVASLQKRKVTRRVALGNGTMALAAAATSIGMADRVSPLGGLLADFSTPTGQRRSFSLPDGSDLTLDARSQADLSSRAGHRGLILRSGMAFVKVLPDGGAFSIAMGGAAASLTEGSVIVSKRQDTCRFICLKGTAVVQLSSGDQRALSAHQGLAIGTDGIHELPESEVQDAGSWLDGKLILHDRTLGDLINAFRPYRAGLLSVSDAAARLRISGVFNLDRLEDLLATMPELYSIRVWQLGPIYTRIDLI